MINCEFNMSKSLYEEAIEAAEQIRLSAESRVKERLVESMSPKIKEMIEKSLLNEGDKDEEKEEKSKKSNEKPKKKKGELLSDEDSTDECGSVDMSEVSDEDFFFANENESTISEEAHRLFSKLASKKEKKFQLENRINKLKEDTRKLHKAFKLSESVSTSRFINKKLLFAYKNLLSEIKNIKSNVILKSDSTLLKEFLNITKELENMSRRRKTRGGFLNESLDDLLEMNLFEEDEEEEGKDLEDEEETQDEPEDDGEEMDLDLDLDSEPVSRGDEDLESLVRRFIDDAEPMLGGGGSEDQELELDLGGEDEDDLEEADDLDEMYEGDDLDELEEDEELKENRVLEIDENMLRKEIMRMKKIREGEAKAMASHFGGGKLGKEMFVDVDEDRDLNVHAGHLGREDVPTPKVEAALRKAARSNRMLESKTRQYKKALRTMKNQLSEMNLFNAKLLYANKLMQNRDLSIKQQRHIVESLDNAKTLGEAKILFESLSKNVKSTTSGKSMNESVLRNTAGSSSRPITSAQTQGLNEGVALDRWATLAGIKR